MTRRFGLALSILCLAGCVDTYEEPDFTRSEPPAHPRGASAIGGSVSRPNNDAGDEDATRSDALAADASMDAGSTADEGVRLDAWTEPAEPEALACPADAPPRNPACSWIARCLASQSRHRPGERSTLKSNESVMSDSLTASSAPLQ